MCGFVYQRYSRINGLQPLPRFLNDVPRRHGLPCALNNAAFQCRPYASQRNGYSHISPFLARKNKNLNSDLSLLITLGWFEFSDISFFRFVTRNGKLAFFG
jgi:hypothetical protein